MNTATTSDRQINGFARHGPYETGARLIIPEPLRRSSPRPLRGEPGRKDSPALEIQPKPPRSIRRLFFRCTRLVLTGAVLSGAVLYTRHIATSATSEVAYINADMLVLRAPIEGELRLEREQPGQLIPAGATLFTVHNSRPGNQESIAQLNWVRELTERLQGEAKEAAVRVQQQQEVYKIHEQLFQQGLISRMAFLEEQTKLTLAQTALASKQTQVYQAETRARELERQAALCRDATIAMPFEGVVWSIAVKSGAALAAYAPVLEVLDRQRICVEALFDEKHAPKLRTGVPVTIRTLDGTSRWPGHVESIRSGVGRVGGEGTPALALGGFTPRRVAVRVKMDGSNSYEASEFFGVGRSVVVTLNDHE